MDSSALSSSARARSARRGHCLRALLLACGLSSAVHLVHAQNVELYGQMEVYFAPEDDAARAIITAIQGARSSVLVQAFSFTHERIARALIASHRRGVKVSVILDQEQYERGFTPVARELLGAGLPVLLDHAHSAAHNKVMIIDPASANAIVITGSFNFTRAAQHRNAENLLLFRGNSALAQRYAENWARHQRHSSALR